MGLGLGDGVLMATFVYPHIVSFGVLRFGGFGVLGFGFGFQGLYQLALFLTFQFDGIRIWGLQNYPNPVLTKNTIIFNTFVFCQVPQPKHQSTLCIAKERRCRWRHSVPYLSSLRVVSRW